MQLTQIRKDNSIPLFLFLTTILSRIPFRSKVLYHMDSVQYALATEHYDISVHQPHPPGYFLYVMLGRLLNTLTHDANTSFVILSILASGAAVVAVYALARRMFDEKTALAAALLAMTSPIVWFNGEVALNYVLEGFLSTLIAYYCWRTINGEQKIILAASVALAFAAGIRQTMLMFLLPLWLLALINVPARYRLYALVLLAVGISSWFFPMISMTGGYTKYREASQELFTYVIAPALKSEKRTTLFFLKTILLFTLHGLGISAAFFLFYVRSHSLNVLRNDILSMRGLFFLLWTLPPLLFYILILVMDTNSGYSLIYLPAFIILAASALVKTAAGSKNVSQWFFMTCFGIALAFNIYMFFHPRSSFSYGFLRTQEEKVNIFVHEVKDRFSPGNTIILARQYIFFGPRHFMYYLPEFRVYIITDNIKRKALWGQHHITHISSGIYIPAEIKYFISPVESSTTEPESSIPCKEVVYDIAFTDDDKFRFCLYDIRFAHMLYPEVLFVNEKYNAKN